MIVTLYNEDEVISFSNEAGLMYIPGIGNLNTEKFKVENHEMELGSRKFRIREATVEDISQSIERAPQIILPKDVLYIGYKMNFPRIGRLLEIGGGSGGFSIMSSVIFGINILSFEINEEIYKILKKNIRRFELEDRIEAKNDDGMEAPVDKYENIFIDNPEPWKFIEGRFTNVKNVGTILPTYSQAEYFSRFMKENDFEVNIHELIDIPIKISEIGIRPESNILYHTGFIVTARKW
ncbi:MAG: hypothetical protein ACP5MU_04995 [Thermoplasmata archaeon]